MGPPEMSEEAFENAMIKHVDLLQLRVTRFSDDDVEEIRKLLLAAGKNAWSARPRTYAVLRIIGLVEVMDTFIDEGLYDISFPYTLETLPLAVKSPGLRHKFIDKQALVLTEFKRAENGLHASLAEDAGIHYEVLRLLGRGGFGTVEKVRSNLSSKNYALKKIMRGKKFEHSDEKEKSFRNEIGSLKKLSHHHLVKYVGSYTDPRFFGLLLETIADCDLKDYLSQDPFPRDDLHYLRQFYGCITSAIAYLHRERFRHKDIKPGNILVRRGEVFVTDFGLALDWSELTKSKTRGPAGAISVQYVAPEVMDETVRGSSADMWSLGCIFLDMTTVLAGETLDAKRNFFESNGSLMNNPRENFEAYSLWMTQIESKHNRSPWLWTKQLIVTEPDDRPTSEELLQKIQCCNDDVDGYLYYCTFCDADDTTITAPLTEADVANDLTSGKAEGKSMSDVTVYAGSFSVIRDGLCHSVVRGDQQDVRLWLKKWENLRIQSSRGQLGNLPECEALHRAARLGHDHIVADLLRYGFDVNALLLGSYPLLLALEVGNNAVLRLLLEQGADLHVRDPGTSAMPLHMAAVKGLESATSLFLDYGADVNALDRNGATPLHLAAMQSHAGVVKLLLKQANIDPTIHEQAFGFTPFHFAQNMGYEPVIRAFLDHGIDVNTPDTKIGGTALHLATTKGNADLVRLLIQAGAQVNLAMRSGPRYTPLHMAVLGGYIGVLRQLLTVEVNPNLKDAEGRTPLHRAVTSTNPDIVLLLLQNGFDIEQKTADGIRPLWLAIGQENAAIAQLLIDHQADVNSTDRGGATMLHHLAAGEETRMLELLVDRGANVNARDNAQNTPLMVAALNGHDSVIQLLLQKKADAQATTRDLETALHFAVAGGHAGAVKALLESAVDVNASSRELWAPLHIAATSDNTSIIEMLVKAGANMSLENGKQQTPLQIAEANGHLALVEMMRRLQV